MIGADESGHPARRGPPRVPHRHGEIGLRVPRSLLAETDGGGRGSLRGARPAARHPSRPHAGRQRRRHRLRPRRASTRIVRAGRWRSARSRRCLLEESVVGWHEFELEVMRDRADNVVIICSIENIDPMGVHTGDSVTVAPALTLTDAQYQELRDAAKAIIRKIGVETGGSNVQFAVDPGDGRGRRHRDEPARLAQLGAGQQGDRLPDRQDRRPARRRLHARRDRQRHHAQDPGLLRAHARLRGRQDAALGVREVPARRTASSPRT